MWKFKAVHTAYVSSQQSSKRKFKAAASAAVCSPRPSLLKRITEESSAARYLGREISSTAAPLVRNAGNWRSTTIGGSWWRHAPTGQWWGDRSRQASLLSSRLRMAVSLSTSPRAPPLVRPSRHILVVVVVPYSSRVCYRTQCAVY